MKGTKTYVNIHTSDVRDYPDEEWNGRYVVIYDYPNKNLTAGDTFKADFFFPLTNTAVKLANGSAITCRSYTWGTMATK